MLRSCMSSSVMVITMSLKYWKSTLKSEIHMFNIIIIYVLQYIQTKNIKLLEAFDTTQYAITIQESRSQLQH